MIAGSEQDLMLLEEILLRFGEQLKSSEGFCPVHTKVFRIKLENPHEKVYTVRVFHGRDGHGTLKIKRCLPTPLAMQSTLAGLSLISLGLINAIPFLL